MVTAALKLRHLPFGQKAMTNLDSILKSRNITLLTKVHLVKAIVFPAVLYGCESWTIKKAECRRTDALELWCWRRLLRVPWTARRSNQSILKEISPEYSLEGLMLKLKRQYFLHLMWRTNSLEKTLMLEKIEGGRWRGWQRMRCLDGITDSMDMNWASSRSWLWRGRPGMLQSMGLQRGAHDWTELKCQRCDLNLAHVIRKLNFLPLYYTLVPGCRVHSAERYQWYLLLRNIHLSCTDKAGMYKSINHDSLLASD